jgi:hypothetical protein
MAKGFKTGGRKKGSRNLTTRKAEALVEKMLQERAAEAIDGAIDSYDFLCRVMGHKEVPLTTRIDVAKTLLKHERPVLQATAVTVLDRQGKDYSDAELKAMIASLTPKLPAPGEPLTIDADCVENPPLKSTQ